METERRVLMRLESSSPEATRAFAAALGRRLPENTVVALIGDLGAGKTTFVRGLAEGLGISAGVASPSYTLMQAHEGGRLPLYHFDAWMEGREKALFLDGGDEWLAAGGVAVVEWASRVEEWLPVPRLELELTHRGPELRGLALAVIGSGAEAAALERLLGLLEADSKALEGLQINFPAGA